MFHSLHLWKVKQQPHKLAVFDTTPANFMC